MGNGYKYNQHHNSFNSSRNFLPLLCRLSIKGVKFPKWSDSDRSSSSSSSSSSFSSDEDPSSPKVSCVGQVKKRNNKLISTAAVPKSVDNFKYNNLRKLFSGKNLLTTATAAGTTFDSSHSCKIRTAKDEVMMRNGSTGMRRSRRPPMAQANVNVLELDPPLPVVKKVQQAGGDEVNLWKRRCGGGNGNGNGNGNGVGLRSLQIQQIHVPNNLLLLLPPTTV